ncbi:transcriptional repressor gene korB [Xanthomonas translucens]|uniref:transcriptional repressor gene korB n=2 Tax=Xanthomonas campestris pv. translucens TaxID=343 RepID=UPI00071E7A47|nr:ParB/RepB/Spo0J family partition protein [Xanthomonas translucens]QSQ62219.1 ParB/RepB/Spo0J family partition protein [Xanthomonas translucens pv. undulosa]UKE41841.1 ParB/RepB/Spo0J family partition protein [Xanthomonas translucens pv. undulosa]UPU47151.1 ParB/RepB/Spo0J family partition protein [Xanthomonas translucens pv. undulosa]
MTSAAKTNAKKKAPQAAAEKPKGGGLGLDGLGDLSSLLDAPQAANAAPGGPQELPLDLIDEDPHQPRTADNPGFSPESIAEIGETIKARGVKSPISVRENQDAPGRYLINHGARRYRGSKWAGKATVPAFIDNDYNEADQVIENLQRNELTAREIADYIGRELAKGKKKSEIAKEIGKSPAFVTQHVTLLDLPEPIAEAFNSGRAKDVTVINELVTAFKKNPEEVGAWLADDSQELTRGSVKLLREYLEDKRSQDSERDPNTVDAFTGKTDGEAGSGDQDQDDDAKGKKEPKEPDPDKLKKAIIQVKHDDRPARLILNRRPPAEGWAWLKYDDDGQEFEADLGTVQLVALLEG